MKNQKSKIFIDLIFQKTFVEKLLSIAFVTGSIILIANFYLYFKFNEYAETLEFEQKKIFYQFFQQQMSLVKWTFISAAVSYTIYLTVSGILTSKRIVSPIQNLKNQLRRIREIKDFCEFEQIENAQFNKKDYFHDLAHEYNLTLQHLKNITSSKTTELNENNVVQLHQNKDINLKKSA